MFTTEQKRFINVCCGGSNIYLNREGKIDVEGFVEIKKEFLQLEKIPVEFGKVTGRFIANKMVNLKTLEGFPSEVGGKFTIIGARKLESLVGGPRITGQKFKGVKAHEIFYDYDAGSCTSLQDLEGAPEEVRGNFILNRSYRVKSLKGAPKKIVGSFEFSGCQALKSLEFLTRDVGEDYYFSMCESMSKEEAILVEDLELMKMWQNSNLSVRDFLSKRRGQIKGRKFGI